MIMILGYEFEHPWILLLLAVVLPLFFAARMIGRKRGVIPYPPVQYKASPWLPKVFFPFTTAMETLLLILLIVSLAKPFKSTETTMISEEGIDVLLAIDISASMQAKDFPPSRLEATKQIVSEFVRRSGGNRVGIVVFAAHVFVLSPLTTDHLVLQHLIDGLSLETIDHYRSGGTAIGDAVARGTDILKQARIEKRDQIMILLTDGDSNLGMEMGLATKYAASENIRIHAIGIGTSSPVEVMPRPSQPDWHFPTQLFEEPMQKIAADTSGRYFHGATKEMLSEVFMEIARLERTPLETESIQQRKYYRYPVNLAVGGLYLVALLTRVIFLRRPLK